MQLQVEGKRDKDEVDCGLPTLKQWFSEKKITLNVYQALTADEPCYNMNLLLLMSQDDIKSLKNDHPHLKFPEILQLINVLKNLPQSQIYSDTIANKFSNHKNNINNNNTHNTQNTKYIPLSQHNNNISKLNSHCETISKEIKDIRKQIKSHESSKEQNVMLIEATFNEISKILVEHKNKLINRVNEISNANTLLCVTREHQLKDLLTKTLETKRQCMQFVNINENENNNNDKCNINCNCGVEANKESAHDDNDNNDDDNDDDDDDESKSCTSREELEDNIKKINDEISKIVDDNNYNSNYREYNVKIGDIDSIEEKVFKKMIQVTEADAEAQVNTEAEGKSDCNSTNWNDDEAFIEHKCCNAFTLSNNNRTCHVSRPINWRLILYGNGISFGKSKYTIEIGSNIYGVDAGVAIALFPMELNNVNFELDYQRAYNYKSNYCWTVFHHGYMYTQGKNTSITEQLTFSKGDTIILSLDINCNGKNEKNVAKFYNQTKKQTFILAGLFYPIRLGFELATKGTTITVTREKYS